ncbi:MAG TPA: hypothetical protein PK926_08070 [Spirochaetota bacterium]|nr:hypothetical protein [Spirochaetota bacterium]HPI88535.1 hypothetical protein [Spirochaetota bacterium]HPR48015.1 hypothetical protein [Spirochaetota bacterium]
MKKTVIILMGLAVAVSLLAGCAEDDESCDKSDVIARIESLEDAINDNNFDQFMENMHSETNQFTTYTEISFNDLTDNGSTDRDFHDYDVSCDGEDRADVDALATVTGVTEDQETFFDMRTEGGDWYVYKWTEETDTMYDKYSPPQQ